MPGGAAHVRADGRQSVGTNAFPHSKKRERRLKKNVLKKMDILNLIETGSPESIAPV